MKMINALMSANESDLFMLLEYFINSNSNKKNNINNNTKEQQQQEQLQQQNETLSNNNNNNLLNNNTMLTNLYENLTSAMSIKTKNLQKIKANDLERLYNCFCLVKRMTRFRSIKIW